MDNFVIGNMVWNAGLIAIVGFFLRKWIGNIETSTKEAALELIKTARELRAETKETALALAAETLKEAGSLGLKIDHIYDELKTANGRMGKLETAVCVQKALCEEKHKKCPKLKAEYDEDKKL